MTYFFPIVSFVMQIGLLVGLYEIGGWTPVFQLDAQYKTHHSIIGDFVYLDTLDIDKIETRWQAGYLDFINLMPVATAKQIASGEYDTQIRNAAESYGNWQELGSGRIAMLVPMPEMNGDWTIYGHDPSNFITAYRHIRQIFDNEGTAAIWVFAPNGWSTPPYAIRDYYPGDDVVDMIGLSGFNFGECAPTTVWQTPQQTYGPYIDQVTAFTRKPIIVSQMGTTSRGGDKETWIRSAYQYLISRNARASIYFNVDKECDWSIDQSPAYWNLVGNRRISLPNALNHLRSQ